MSLQRISFLLFLFFAQSIVAKNPETPFRIPGLVFTNDVTCNLPPPSQLNVDAVGTDWVRVSWPLVNNASQYRLQAYDGAGDEIGAPVFVSGLTTTATLSTAGNQGSVFVRIWSVCENGGYNADDFTDSDTVDTIIIEVVTGGFSMPNYNATQVVGVGIAGGVNIPWDGGWEFFNITYDAPEGQVGRRFALYVKSNGSPDRVTIPIGVAGNSGELIVILPEPENTRMRIGYRINPNAQPTTIAVLEASHVGANSIPGKWYRTTFENVNCVVERTYWDPNHMVAPGGNLMDGVAVEKGTASAGPGRVVATPNPFHNFVNLNFPAVDDPNGQTIQLYDVMGKELMRIQVPAGQTECRLYTERFEAGVYFLRIASGGKTETIQLVKPR